MSAVSEYRPGYIVFPGRRSLANLARLAGAALSSDDDALDVERDRQAKEASCTR